MRHPQPRWICICWTMVFSLTATSAWATKPVDFSRDIKPILADKCFTCHGPDKDSVEADLRLDRKESVFGATASGVTPVVPGNEKASELIARITADDEFMIMPPADGPKKLSVDEIEMLRSWVQQGAPWEEHWAYRPPTKPAVPQVARKNWPLGDVDRFILARLEHEGLQPSPEADKITLLRRVTFDLTGLPPTPAETRAFLNDKSPDAYEKVVERLLASPRYGEHMARYWLDAVRYGDTHGLHLDNYREMWPYRDWVVEAFNVNKPFDRFIIEQLAGDLLPEPTREQLIATGYVRCHVTTSEGGSIAEEVYVRNVVDRVVNFGTVFMGATFECTRCHDHKFDPYTMEDFYSLFAYFNSIDGNPLDGNKKDPAPVIQVPSPEQEQRMADLTAKIAVLAKRMNDAWPAVDAAQKEWEQAVAAEFGSQSEQADWQIVVPETFRSRGGAELQKLEDNSLLAGGSNAAKEVYEIISPLEGTGWLTVRLEGLMHPSLTNGGVGRSPNSNVVLTEFEAYVSPADKPEKWQRVKIKNAWADYEQPNGDFKIANAIDGKPETGWAVGGHMKREDRQAYFVAEKPFGVEKGAMLKVVLKHESVYGQHQFGRVRLAVSKVNPIPNNVPANILATIRLDAEKRDAKQQAELQQHYRKAVSTFAELVEVRKELAELEKSKKELSEQIPTTLVFREKKEPKPAFILHRGEYDQQREEVKRRTPLVLPSLPNDFPNDRLGLARWLVAPSHPLTARVTVNRFWQQLFGTGLVKTAGDFGSQGEPPSHRQLLDYLAVTFMESGWDVKAFMRQLVTSATYRQSSHVTGELLKRDPQNRLLARGPRFRLDAEMIRDQALFASGLLVEKLGGPSVKPPQPDGLWFAVGYTNSNTARFVADEGPEKVHRRTLYTFIKRTSPPPEMSTFDAPSREAGCVRRERTDTPLQALLLFNDPQFVEAARVLATRTLHEANSTDEARAAYMFELLNSRVPNNEELTDLVNGYRDDLKSFRDDPQAAKSLIAVGSAPVDETLDAAELAAWTMTANMLLCTDEVLNKN